MRVTFVVRYDAGLYRGGGEVQAAQTAEALRRAGIEVTFHDALRQELGDLVHFFGRFPYLWEVAGHCLDRKVPYVVSPIFVEHQSGAALRFRRFRHRVLQRKYPRDLERLLRGAQALFPLTRFEEEKLLTYFGPDLPARKIIPNGVESRFAHGDPEAFAAHCGVRGPFVLHCASVEPNKNQLTLVRALRDTSFPVVFLGQIRDAAYAEACRRESGPTAHWVGEVPYESAAMPGAYAAARLSVLPSRLETFSLAAIEGLVAGLPVILSNTWRAHDLFGDQVMLVEPGNVHAWRQAVEQAWKQPPNRLTRSEAMLKQYSWDAVGQKLIGEYQAVLRSRQFSSGP